MSALRCFASADAFRVPSPAGRFDSSLIRRETLEVKVLPTNPEQELPDSSLEAGFLTTNDRRLLYAAWTMKSRARAMYAFKSLARDHGV